MKEDFNFGKQRIIIERGRAYIQTVMFVIQFAMIFALTMKSYNLLTWYWLTAIAVIFISSAILFVKFMRFDINKNLPAEYDWTWRMNPAWHELNNKLNEMSEKLSRLTKEI